MFDTVIRGATVVDGSGSAPFTGDVAIQDGRIAAVGGKLGAARRDMDASGAIVTPGWVDVHTHYDGQVTWDPYLSPSTHHGVTTAVMGNCGVGFAPVKPERREWLISVMEGVEDIPGTVLSEGIQWEWETFPQYLDALAAKPRALDVGAQEINEAMKLACVRAIAALARKEASDLGSAYGGEVPKFGAEYLIPRPFDPRLLTMLAPCVAQAAMDSGIAERPIADIAAYKEKLGQFIHRTSLMMKPVYERARSERKRVAYAEGEEYVVLQAVQTVIDEGLAFPILIGRPEVIENRIAKLGLRMRAGVDFELTNINDDPRFDDYWRQYHALTERRGVTPDASKNLIRSRPTIIAALMVERGEADGLITGIVGRYHKKLGYLRSIFDFDTGVQGTAAMTGVINDKGAWFFVDTHVQMDPSAEQIAEATMQAAYRLKLFGIEPKVALLSHSNFGSHQDASATKMRRAYEIVRARAPKLEIDGEMMADTAWDEALRQRIMPNTTLSGRANLLVMPNLDAANIGYNLIRVATGGVAIGPILMGLDQPAHILTPASSSRRVVNMTAIVAVEAQIRAAMTIAK